MNEDSQDFLVDDILGDGQTIEHAWLPDARAHRRHAKHLMERVTRTQSLHAVVKGPPAPGESIHVISGARFDFWTWVPGMIEWLGQLEALYCSTWTANRENAIELLELWDAGKIAPRGVNYLTGDYFVRRETAVYALLLEGIRSRGGRFVAFHNHSKVLLMAAPAAGYLVVEGSANLTSNPRLEQYVISNDRSLYEFHRGWMEEALTKQAPQAHGPN